MVSSGTGAGVSATGGSPTATVPGAAVSGATIATGAAVSGPAASSPPLEHAAVAIAAAINHPTNRRRLIDMGRFYSVAGRLWRTEHLTELPTDTLAVDLVPSPHHRDGDVLASG
jgi:hypothetical protein